MTDDAYEQLQKWQQQWDAIQKVEEKEVPINKPLPTDYFGQYNIPQDQQEIDGEDWNRLYRMSTGESEILTEVKEPSKEDMISTVKAIANSPNPIHFNTVGKDTDYETAINEKELADLAELKVKLEELEAQLNSNDALSKKTEDIQVKIDGMKKKIDEISDNLMNSKFKKD